MNIKDYKNIYMSGIGGISMSGIAEILISMGYNVSGSDISSSNITDMLVERGIKVFFGQVEENITSDIDLLVYTAAVKEDNPERMKAKELGIPSVERGTFLGELTKLYDCTIGISGTHGKTTTTSMLSCIFIAANTDPSIQVGSLLKQIKGNYRVGKSDIFIIEACEYSDSYLNFKQKYALITNIDNDHLDYFKNFDNIVISFKKYVSLLPEDGVLVINKDDENAMKIIDSTKARIVTYGINENAMYSAKNVIINENGCGQYDIYQQDSLIGSITLSVPGMHNVSNSLGAAALALEYGLDIKDIAKGLLDYEGAARRFEYKGVFFGAKVYDDYGHHPTEVDAIQKAVSQTKHNESWVIFEAHTYSRVKNHLIEFSSTLAKFDNIIVIDIYAAREKDTLGMSPQLIVEEIKKYNRNVLYIPETPEIYNFLKSRVKEHDIVLTLGAGIVNKVGNEIVNKAKTDL